MRIADPLTCFAAGGGGASAPSQRDHDGRWQRHEAVEPVSN